eukprot:394502_1
MSNICIHDRVTLHNDNEGEIKFMGMIEGKSDIYYGIKLDTDIGKNNGMFESIQYFECSNNYGIFVTKDKIKSHKSTPSNESLPHVCIGDTVYANNKRENGILRFVGTVHFDYGCFYGIELMEPLGDHNGSIDNRQYFDCPQYYGTFCKSNDIKLIKKMNPNLISISTETIEQSLETKQDLLSISTSKKSNQLTTNHLQIPNNTKPFSANNPSFDPELHDLDPDNDDIYKPIASTYKTDENDEGKQQSLIHYNNNLDINDDQWQPISVPVPVPISVPIPVNVSVSNPATMWQQMNMNNPSITAPNYQTNNQFIPTIQHMQSNMQWMSFPFEASHNKYNNMYNMGQQNIVNEYDKWKQARDPSSGRAYWYHIDTKATTWEKPLCIKQKVYERMNKFKHNPYCDENMSKIINTYSPTANKQFINKHMINYNICRDNRTSQHNKYWVIGSRQEFQMETWAKQRYQIELHKKGLFSRRQQTVYDILSYVEYNKMKYALNKNSNSNNDIKVQCMQMWKNINSYMGLRKSRKSSHGHVDKLLCYALNGCD